MKNPNNDRHYFIRTAAHGPYHTADGVSVEQMNEESLTLYTNDGTLKHGYIDDKLFVDNNGKTWAVSDLYWDDPAPMNATAANNNAETEVETSPEYD